MYKQSWKQLQSDERKNNKEVLRGIFAYAAVLSIIILLFHGCVGSVVRVSELQYRPAQQAVYTSEQQEYKNFDRSTPSKITWSIEKTYRKPAAFRKASPTQAEMDHLHGLMQVMEVMR